MIEQIMGVKWSLNKCTTKSTVTDDPLFKYAAALFLTVFIYVNFMLSKLNFVEQRVWLAVVGILSVVMGKFP